MRALILTLLVGCGTAAPPLPAPYDALPIRTSSIEVAVKDGALSLQYPEGVSWRQGLGRLAADLEGAGWARDTEMPIPGGMTVMFSKGTQTVKILAGGKTGHAQATITLDGP